MMYMDDSRPYDWLCMNFVEGMLTKARLIINFHTGTVPTNTMPLADRMTLLESSVDIIKRTHALAVDDRISDWVWYFRGYVQWHSLAIVVAELGWSRDEKFVTMAWNVLDDILGEWDSLYQTKKDDPAWTHVNESIQRARKLRKRNRLTATSEGHSQHKKPRHTAPPTNHVHAPGPSGGGLAQSIAHLRQPLQHRPAPSSTMPQQYIQNAAASSYYDGHPQPYTDERSQPYNNTTSLKNEVQTSESQVPGGPFGPGDEVSPMSSEGNFDDDPFPNVNWNAYNSVFTNDVWDTWNHMPDMQQCTLQNDTTSSAHTWWPPQQNNIMQNYGQYSG